MLAGAVLVQECQDAVAQEGGLDCGLEPRVGYTGPLLGEGGDGQEQE